MRSNLFFASCLLLLAGCGEAESLPFAPEENEAAVIPEDPGEEVGDELNDFIGGIKEILPGFAAFGRRHGREVDLLDANGRKIASLRLAPAEYERVEGFNGFVDVAVVVQKRRIAGVVIGKNQETPRWVKMVKKSGLLKKWNGRTLPEASGMEVDAVTGATFTSEAVKGEVKAVVQ